jgi:hypothetical protein
VVACLLALMMSRTFARNAWTFFFDGVVRRLPLYLRMVWPRKSNPSSICVILVFSGESSSLNYSRGCTGSMGEGLPEVLTGVPCCSGKFDLG